MNSNQVKTAFSSGISGALMTLLLYVLEQFHITLPADVSDALMVLLVAGLGWIAHREGISASTDVPAPSTGSVAGQPAAASPLAASQAAAGPLSPLQPGVPPNA